MSVRRATACLVLGAVLIVIEPRDAFAAPRNTPRLRSAGESLIWTDEFDGPRGTRPDRRKWSFETGFGLGDGELQSYTDRSSNASLDGKGRLVISARRERYTGRDGATASYTSARLNTHEKFEFAYGRLMGRIRAPAGRGLLPAFWALGTNLGFAGWPASGEIDLMEVNAAEPSTLHGTLHGPRGGYTDYTLETKLQTAAPLSDAFHVYGISWSPGRIAFTFDGRIFAVRVRGSLPRDAEWSFDRPFFLVLTLTVGPRWLGPPDSTTRWPASMLVDWVRVWSGPETFCPTVRARNLRPRCPRRDSETARW